MLSSILLNYPFSLNLILTFYKVVNVKGDVKAGKQTISCTFKLAVCEGVMDNKKSTASCKPKVNKRPTTIRNHSITGNRLIFKFTLNIPKRGKITFLNSEVTPEATTTPTTTPTNPPTTTTNNTPGKF